MLTKDLVRFSNKRNAIVPDFIDPDNSRLRQIAEQLLEVFRHAEGKTRSVLEEESKLVVDAAEASGVLVRGFEKLLFDRVEFDTRADEDLIAWRHQLFLKTNALLTHKAFATLDDYHTAVAKESGEGAGDLSNKLFSDLPENQPVTRFRPLSSERLLHRYNCALVQWLLLHCHSLIITAAPADAVIWRQLFRRLRFQQLLAEIRKKRDGRFEIRVDGPLSLFMQTKKYGMALANFFPAILHLKEWELRAKVELRNRKPKDLVLDASCALRSFSNAFLSHVPEEIRMFQELFEKKCATWKIETAAEFVLLGGDAYGFPDFQFQHPSGASIAMELFHPWHGAPLRQRLEQLATSKEPSLLIGVAKKLTKDESVLTLLNQSDYFQAHGFTFRDMPNVSDVMPLLDRLLS